MTPEQQAGEWAKLLLRIREGNIDEKFESTKKELNSYKCKYTKFFALVSEEVAEEMLGLVDFKTPRVLLQLQKGSFVHLDTQLKGVQTKVEAEAVYPDKWKPLFTFGAHIFKRSLFDYMSASCVDTLDKQKIESWKAFHTKAVGEAIQ